MRNFFNWTVKCLTIVLSVFAINAQAQFCDQAQGTPGFPSDIPCQNAICAADPFCCNNTWDLICGNAAATSPACVDCVSTGGGGDPNCSATLGAGITFCDFDTASAAYAQVILDDPFCCDTTWDLLCQDSYVLLGGLPNPDPACGGGGEPGGPCEIVVNVFSASWGDATNWTLTGTDGLVALSGGFYGNGYNDTQVLTNANNGPYTLTIISTLGDNIPNYTVTVGGVLVASGIVPGLTTGTENNIAAECSEGPIGVGGCTYAFACNFDPEATFDDGSCEIGSCTGCTYNEALNFNPVAVYDDGSCVFDLILENQCPGDINEDNVINTADLIVFLGVFGTVCE